MDLLQEKNAELEKGGALVKNENQLLLVRFRGAHERRVKAEKALNAMEQEVDRLKMLAGGGGDAGGGGGGYQMSHGGGYIDEHAQDMYQQHGIYAEHARRPQSASTKPGTPGRWK